MAPVTCAIVAAYPQRVHVTTSSCKTAHKFSNLGEFGRVLGTNCDRVPTAVLHETSDRARSATWYLQVVFTSVNKVLFLIGPICIEDGEFVFFLAENVCKSTFMIQYIQMSLVYSCSICA